MRKVLYAGVATAAIALGAQSAMAADIYVPPPPEVALAPQPVGGWYVSLFGGATFPLKMDTKANYTYGPYWFGDADGDLKFDTGFIVGGAIGYELMTGLRGEIEVSYTQFGNDKLEGSYSFYYYGLVGGSSYSYSAGGHTDVLFVLGNLWYDFDMGSPIKPYIGGGIGVGFVNSDVKVGGTKVLDDSDTNFAFQVGAGIKWALSESIDLDVSYRFRGVLGVELKDSFTGPFGTVNTELDDDLYMHSVQAGITFHFGGY